MVLWLSFGFTYKEYSTMQNVEYSIRTKRYLQKSNIWKRGRCNKVRDNEKVPSDNSI